jgi:phage terminase large subunit-like protein
MIDSITKSWIRNEADERAAARGHRFDLERAAWTTWWIPRYCRLYEGEFAGQPLILRAAESMPYDAILDEWEKGGKNKSIQRVRDYMDCVQAGEQVDWQFEFASRVFGWVVYDDFWKKDVRRFKRGAVWVPKKSKKSPTMAATSLYLLCGDGEQGGKVFLGAKDGAQLKKNVALHIFYMLQQSDELRGECKTNANEMTVSHLRTRSMLIPLSSSNERTQKSKEGLNGSLLIDETHVVDRAFIDRITRMGISRSEPIILQFSTAGDDPDSYGKEEFDRGVAVNEGRVEDDRYFCEVHSAPQDLSDADLSDDPEKYIRMANPAIGHTINIREALDDYQTSKATVRELTLFKMYRLNLWQRSSNPWIRADDWRKCRRPFTAADLRGHVCGAALDLGRVDDMSSAGFIFPDNPDAWVEMAREIKEAAPDAKTDDPEVAKRIMVLVEQPVKLLTFYWLPEESVEKFRGDAPYAQWVRDGWLRTYAGGTVDSTVITEALREVFSQYDCKMFAYDPWYAAPIVKVLLGQNVLPEDYTWKFEQTIHNYAWPATLLERLIVAGNLHQDGNPITAWEMGHVQVKEDNNGNIRPVKPKRGEHKKIDGVVAACMALDAATRLAVNISVYETRGVLEF